MPAFDPIASKVMLATTESALDQMQEPIGSLDDHLS